MTYSKGSPDKPEVSVTFRLSRQAHEEMMREVGYCGCNVSGFIRLCVMKEIHDRRGRRKQAADHAVLVGQLEASGGDDA